MMPISIKCVSHKQAFHIIPDHMTHLPRSQASGSASTTNPNTKTMKLAGKCRLQQLHQPGRNEGGALTSGERRLLGKLGKLGTDTYTALYSLSSVILLESPKCWEVEKGGGETLQERKLKFRAPVSDPGSHSWVGGRDGGGRLGSHQPQCSGSSQTPGDPL